MRRSDGLSGIAGIMDPLVPANAFNGYTMFWKMFVLLKRPEGGYPPACLDPNWFPNLAYNQRTGFFSTRLWPPLQFGLDHGIGWGVDAGRWSQWILTPSPIENFGPDPISTDIIPNGLSLPIDAQAHDMTPTGNASPDFLCQWAELSAFYYFPGPGSLVNQHLRCLSGYLGVLPGTGGNSWGFVHAAWPGVGPIQMSMDADEHGFDSHYDGTMTLKFSAPWPPCTLTYLVTMDAR